ncbi:hypothetical protein HDU96_007728 [Phlyctochytrium bullatum]|nr:hypothetical protein HDU96_007728 [Phlyctochytrium bullatum]
MEVASDGQAARSEYKLDEELERDLSLALTPAQAAELHQLGSRYKMALALVAMRDLERTMDSEGFSKSFLETQEKEEKDGLEKAKAEYPAAHGNDLMDFSLPTPTEIPPPPQPEPTTEPPEVNQLPKDPTEIDIVTLDEREPELPPHANGSQHSLASSKKSTVLPPIPKKKPSLTPRPVTQTKAFDFQQPRPRKESAAPVIRRESNPVNRTALTPQVFDPTLHSNMKVEGHHGIPPWQHRPVRKQYPTSSHFGLLTPQFAAMYYQQVLESAATEAAGVLPSSDEVIAEGEGKSIIKSHGDKDGNFLPTPLPPHAQVQLEEKIRKIASRSINTPSKPLTGTGHPSPAAAPSFMYAGLDGRTLTAKAMKEIAERRMIAKAQNLAKPLFKEEIREAEALPMALVLGK